MRAVIKFSRKVAMLSLETLKTRLEKTTSNLI